MKKITFINLDIPGQEKYNSFFNNKLSLDESDIVIIKPFENYLNIESRYQGKDSYGDSGSKTIKEDSEYWKNEILSFIKSGRNVFVIVNSFYDFFLQTGRFEISGTGTRARRTNYVEPYDNYKFIEKIKLRNTHGSSFKVIDNSMNELVKTFSSIISFKCYIDADDLKPLLATKNGSEIVSGIIPMDKGNLVFLPYINFENLTEIQNGKKEWSKQALQLGINFRNFIIELNNKILDSQEKSIKPTWLENDLFKLKIELELGEKITRNNQKIEKLTSENNNIIAQINKEIIIKDLIFETGKQLEKAVIKALEILGYSAENYDNGKLELDAVIVSPEGDRFIGECEGKDNKDIDVSKFRQLNDSLAEDFEREEVLEKAKGIIFGNPQRLLDLGERTLDFTEKCKAGAKRENIALINTADLFFVSKYILESKDEVFKKKRRDSIISQLGSIVVFPKIEKT